MSQLFHMSEHAIPRPTNEAARGLDQTNHALRHASFQSSTGASNTTPYAAGDYKKRLDHVRISDVALDTIPMQTDQRCATQDTCAVHTRRTDEPRGPDAPQRFSQAHRHLHRHVSRI